MVVKLTVTLTEIIAVPAATPTIPPPKAIITQVFHAPRGQSAVMDNVQFPAKMGSPTATVIALTPKRRILSPAIH